MDKNRSPKRSQRWTSGKHNIKVTIGLVICPQWVGGEEGCAGDHRADISGAV